MDLLVEKLQELDRAWERRGVPVHRVLAAGVPASAVQDALPDWRVPAQLTSWFAWHNGSLLSGGKRWVLAPSSWDLFSLEDVRQERDVARDLATDLLGSGDSELRWQSAWIPFIGSESRILVVHSDSGAVLRADLADPDRFGEAVASDIAELVDSWLAALASDLGEYRYLSNGIWEFDWLGIPPEVKRFLV